MGADRKAWESGRFPGEDDDLEHQLVSAASLSSRPDRRRRRAADEGGDEWDGDETDPLRALRPAAVGPTARRRAVRRTMTAAPRWPFDLRGPLPDGITVLEASAGTGKTFTIAALVARYVAEDVVPLDQLLVVTLHPRWRPASCASACGSVSCRRRQRSPLAGRRRPGPDRRVLVLLTTVDVDRGRGTPSSP